MHRMGDVARIGDFGIWYIVFLFTLTLHERGTARRVDRRRRHGYRGGQVTLNPWPTSAASRSGRSSSRSSRS